MPVCPDEFKIPNMGTSPSGQVPRQPHCDGPGGRLLFTIEKEVLRRPNDHVELMPNRMSSLLVCHLVSLTIWLVCLGYSQTSNISKRDIKTSIGYSQKSFATDICKTQQKISHEYNHLEPIVPFLR